MLFSIAHKVWQFAKRAWLGFIIALIISFAANLAVVKVTDASNILIVAIVKWLFLPGIHLGLTLSILTLITLISLSAGIITLLNSHGRDIKILVLYLNSVIKRNEHINTKGFYQKTQALISVSIPLNDVFIQLQAKCDRPLYDMPSEQQKLSKELLYHPDLSEEEREERVQRQHVIWHSQLGYDFEDVQEIFIDNIIHHLSAEHPVAIILGSPGSGKSTVLQWFALQMARTYLKADYDLPENLRPKQIPILLRISDYVKQLVRQETEKPSIKDYLIQQASRIHSELPSKLLDELQQGHCLVLLDGLDEVTNDSIRRRVIESINEFVSEYSPISTSVQSFNRFVFTSRIVGYEAGSFAKYAHYTLVDLNNAEIEDFLTKWCPAIERHQVMTTQGMNPLTLLQESQLQKIGLEQKDNLLNIFDDRPSIKRMAVNPLMLTMLTLIQRSKGNLPQRRVALYQIVTRTLLATWNKESGRNYIEEVSLVEHILSDLAFQLHSTDLFLTEQSIKTIVGQAVTELTGYPAKSNDIHQFIDTIRSSSGLIIEIGQGLYSFMHRAFQEYFVALYLLRMTPETLKQFAKQHYLEPIWHEPLLLAIAYKSEQSSHEDHQEASELIQCILETNNEYDTILYRNLLFAANSLEECSVWTIDRTIQQTIAHRLFDLYGDALGKGRYTTLQQEIEAVASHLLYIQTQGNTPNTLWPPFLKEWRTALYNNGCPQGQLGASRLIAAIAPDMSNCPQIVLHALIPPLIRLTRLSSIPLPSEIKTNLPQSEISPAFQRIEEYAFMALCFLHASGPIGWLDAEWDQWKEEHTEQFELLKQHGNELGYILPPFDIEKKMSNERRRRGIVSSKEIAEELLKKMKTVRQPHAYLLMQILNKEEPISEASWRTIWDIFLQEEMKHGRSFTYQVCLDIRLLLRRQNEQQIRDIADELIEALSKQGPQQVQALITLTNIHLQQHLDLMEMSGLIGMPDLRRMRLAWTKWDTLDLHGMPGMRGLRELLILRYMRVILDRADLTELISVLDRERMINAMCNMLEQAVNVCTSEILLCLYSILTMFNPIPSYIIQQIQVSMHLVEQHEQSITTEDRMLMIAIQQFINSPVTTKITPTLSTTIENPDKQAAALMTLRELPRLTTAQVEVLLFSSADTREVTEDSNLEFGPTVRSVAWRLIEQQYELDDEAYVSAINALSNTNPHICAAAALLLRRVKAPPGHLLKETINKIITLLSDEMLSSRPLDPPDYKYWRLDDVLYGTLKALIE